MKNKDSIDDIMNLPLLTIKQTALLLQVSTKTIHNKIDKGDLPCLRIGKVIRIKRVELLNLDIKE